MKRASAIMLVLSLWLVSSLISARGEMVCDRKIRFLFGDAILCLPTEKGGASGRVIANQADQAISNVRAGPLNSVPVVPSPSPLELPATNPFLAPRNPKNIKFGVDNVTNIPPVRSVVPMKPGG